ncbi:M20 metallopeptidase family protein [Tindallia californiensis]|uniref:Amidohydrolase n=1 Tax=Tindallia californiensis TaxID=159292 RepID=A0A1H3P7V9_9FIRM|nr:M20 family metallopeptidase [Tindallia californiensis]SDY97168.1 amidohydrolase [Tindallia californiensis]
MNEIVRDKIEANEAWIINHRRALHQIPEKSKEEWKTKEYIKKSLTDLGIEVKEGYYNTGLVGVIYGEQAGRTIGIRFDMDALEMEEKVETEFKSLNKGLMHACGHDGHMAMGLGCAKVLNEMKDQICGVVKLVFQPAEEDATTGGGAQHMIKDGVLSDEPKIEAMVGMHIWPKLKVGEVGSRVGPIMAASDPFNVEVVGKGVHASLPYMGIDPIITASQIIVNLQSVISRNISPFEQGVMSIGIMQGGTQYNTIPERVHFYGTVRSFNEETRLRIHDRMKTVIEKGAEAMNAKAKFNYTFGYPAVINNEKMVKIAKFSTEEMLGEGSYIEVDQPAPGGEDFAFFAKEVPSVFLWLGYGEEEEIHPPHSPHYEFNEAILALGTKVLCKTALEWCRLNK